MSDSTLYVSKYLNSLEPLEVACREGYDFSYDEISDVLKRVDEEFERKIRDAKAEAWAECYETGRVYDPENGALIEAKYVNPYVEWLTHE